MSTLYDGRYFEIIDGERIVGNTLSIDHQAAQGHLYACLRGAARHRQILVRESRDGAVIQNATLEPGDQPACPLFPDIAELLEP